MNITVDPLTQVIFIAQAELTPVSGVLYELDVNALRIALKDWEDDAANISMLDTHNHNAPVVLSGVTYARSFEVINGYTITFEDGQYTVRCVGANHNIADVKNANQVSLIVGNSAGLQVVTVVSGSGVTAQDKTDIIDGTWAKVLEGLTAEEMMRVMLAALAGKRTGLGTATETYMAQDGTTPRITLTPDQYGNGDRRSRDASAPPFRRLMGRRRRRAGDRGCRPSRPQRPRAYATELPARKPRQDCPGAAGPRLVRHGEGVAPGAPGRRVPTTGPGRIG